MLHYTTFDHFTSQYITICHIELHCITSNYVTYIYAALYHVALHYINHIKLN